MKETKIAKENVEFLKMSDEECKEECEISEDDKCSMDAQARYFEGNGYCKEHKQTCQRWLKFEEKWYDQEGAEGCDCELCRELIKKIKDLKQAIKLYEDAGI